MGSSDSTDVDKGLRGVFLNFIKFDETPFYLICGKYENGPLTFICNLDQ